VLFLKVGVSLDKKLENHPQVTLVEGDLQIDEELRLFTVSNIEKCYSEANDALYEEKQKDKFLHEQNLIIKETQSVLIMGCGHAGVVNILEKAGQYDPKICIGGYHLFNPVTKKTVSDILLNQIIVELQRYPGIKFYTCHCTGAAAFQYLSNRIPNMSWISCGQSIEV
jgi:7,8-dihydropterin-6-yl-methyl-4-(beta-D-ribofuranosyl)aminobenzene 5'-phosphate synthase